LTLFDEQAAPSAITALTTKRHTARTLVGIKARQDVRRPTRPRDQLDAV
jgi:hypothetical protein